MFPRSFSNFWFVEVETQRDYLRLPTGEVVVKESQMLGPVARALLVQEHAHLLAQLSSERGSGEPHPGPSGGRGAAVPCCTVRRSDGGVVVSFACNFPGCDKEYASRDAVRKHCRIRHLAWLQSLQALWQLEDRGAEVGSD